MVDDRRYPAHATLPDGVVDNEGIRSFELERARHALAYLKEKLGEEAMRSLLADDTALMKDRVRGWVEEADGAWRTGEVELVVPEPPAADLHRWYEEAMVATRDADFRAGHPEHFVSHVRPDGIEVIENVGETELPWRVLYRGLPEDADFPTPWDPDYPVRFGAELIDADGHRVGFTMHALRDEDDGVHIKMTTNLPAAVPEELVARHLRHYAIEFRNWAQTASAWFAAGASYEFGVGAVGAEAGHR